MGVRYTYEPAQAQPRVVIADDDPIARRAIRDALQDAGVIVIAEAENGRDAVELSAHYQPDIVLMEVVMPVMDGITATRRLAAQSPEVKVVMLSADENEEVGLTCLRIGAVGFLSKAIPLSALARALRAAVAGEAIISRGLATRLVESVRRSAPDGVGVRPVRSPLTEREWEVLDLLCRGLSTDAIAETLVLSTETIRSHVKHILRKLQVHSRDQAVRAARDLRADIFALEQAVT
jgi:NarL family two-component system response regulator LiaR